MKASHRRTRQAVLVVVMVLGAGSAAGACSGSDEANCKDTLTCTPYCNGACVPWVPPELYDVVGPVLLWLGPRGAQVPSCPSDASGVRDLYKDLVTETPVCPRCGCTAPACVLPAGVTASTTKMCQPGQPDAYTPLRPPAGWDGACFGGTPIPPERVVSIAFEPPTEQPCQPIEPDVPRRSNDDEARNWNTVARACAGVIIQDYDACNSNDKVCFPTWQKPAQGFQVCLRQSPGAHDTCPDPYPVAITLFDHADDGQCSPCDCVPTRPSACEALVSTYQDAACSVGVDSAFVPPSTCHGVSPSVSLGSVRASWIKNAPGACVATGGQPIVKKQPIDAQTFCCPHAFDTQPVTSPFPVP